MKESKRKRKKEEEKETKKRNKESTKEPQLIEMEKKNMKKNYCVTNCHSKVKNDNALLPVVFQVSKLA